MGMMNNCYYRVKVHTHVDAANGGALCLRFQHPAPVPPGEQGNVGWREEEHLAREAAGAPAAAAAAAAAAAPKAAAAANGGPRIITMEEVEQHASEESAWFVHEGKVRFVCCVRFALGWGVGLLSSCLPALCLPPPSSLPLKPPDFHQASQLP